MSSDEEMTSPKRSWNQESDQSNQPVGRGRAGLLQWYSSPERRAGRGRGRVQQDSVARRPGHQVAQHTDADPSSAGQQDTNPTRNLFPSQQPQEQRDYAEVGPWPVSSGRTVQPVSRPRVVGGGFSSADPRLETRLL